MADEEFTQLGIRQREVCLLKNAQNHQLAGGQRLLREIIHILFSFGYVIHG